MTVQIPAPRDGHITLNYYAPLDSQPAYNYVDPCAGGIAPPEGIPKTNVGEENHPAIIRDTRGTEDTFSLDVHGFQFIRVPSIEKDFTDEDRIQTVYYAEIEEILKRYTGAKRVVVFRHSVRRNVADQRGALSIPYHHVHVDVTPEAAVARVKRHFGDEAERLLQGRYGVISIWRPIANTVAHEPLAVVDYRSIDPNNDLVFTRYIRADRESSIFNVRYNPEHKWHYLSDQSPDEITLIKMYDSHAEKACCTPHSAFHDSSSAVDAPHRQSIEVGAIVCYTE